MLGQSSYLIFLKIIIYLFYYLKNETQLIILHIWTNILNKTKLNSCFYNQFDLPYQFGNAYEKVLWIYEKFIWIYEKVAWIYEKVIFF
jgi:hypothetical protein